MAEKDLQSKINADILSLGWAFWHRQKGRTHRPTSSNSINLENKKCTYPDLLVMPGHDKVFFVEVKDGSNKLTEEQKNFREWALKMNYSFYTVTNFLEWESVKQNEV